MPDKYEEFFKEVVHMVAQLMFGTHVTEAQARLVAGWCRDNNLDTMLERLETN
jgi:hypothetical protein